MAEPGTCPTIKVTTDVHDGPIVINETDFDPKVHTKYVEPKSKPASSPKVAIEPPKSPGNTLNDLTKDNGWGDNGKVE